MVSVQFILVFSGDFSQPPGNKLHQLLFCLSRSEITGSPIYRPINRSLTWVSSRPMQLCGYCSAHPASPQKQPRLWARRPTQHSCLYPNLFVYSYATVRLSLWEIYILFCSVLFFFRQALLPTLVTHSMMISLFHYSVLEQEGFLSLNFIQAHAFPH